MYRVRVSTQRHWSRATATATREPDRTDRHGGHLCCVDLLSSTDAVPPELLRTHVPRWPGRRTLTLALRERSACPSVLIAACNVIGPDGI